MTRFALWVSILAACVVSRAQVINPIPSNPGPYLGPVSIYLIESQTDGKVVLTGYFYLFAGIEQKSIIRLNADGSFDETFNAAQLPTEYYGQSIHALLALPDNKLLVGVGSTNGLHRLNTDGSLDSTFQMEPLQNDGNYYYNTGIYGIIRQNDGKIIVNGSFTQIGTNMASDIARLNPDGSFDPTFHPQFTLGTNTSSYLNTLARQDGKIIVTGGFDAVDGLPYNYFARLNADGTVDQTLVNNTNLSMYEGFYDVQADGKIITGGRLGIMRLNADGGVDYRFNPGLGISGTNRYVISARCLPGGDLLLHGNFDKYDNQSRRSLARINEDGSLDTGFDARLTKTSWARYTEVTVSAVKTLSDGSFYIAGSFTGVQGKSITGLARIKADGNVDESFNPFQPALRTASMTSDGLYQFRVSGEKWRPYVVEVSNDLKTWQPLRNVMITELPLYFIDLRPPSVIVPLECRQNKTDGFHG